MEKCIGCRHNVINETMLKTTLISYNQSINHSWVLKNLDRDFFRHKTVSCVSQWKILKTGQEQNTYVHAGLNLTFHCLKVSILQLKC